MNLPSIATRRRVLAGEIPGWIERHSRKARLLKVILSVPDWVDRKALRALDKEASRRSRVGVRTYQVDHIVPVDHPLVCGLTVPWNLRIITAHENNKRSNRWWEFTPDLFSDPEQLRIL
jgi:hypothetical protein